MNGNSRSASKQLHCVMETDERICRSVKCRAIPQDVGATGEPKMADGGGRKKHDDKMRLVGMCRATNRHRSSRGPRHLPVRTRSAQVLF